MIRFAMVLTSLSVLGCDPEVSANRGATAMNLEDASTPPANDAAASDASTTTLDSSGPSQNKSRVTGTTESLNLRAGPSTDDAIVGSIPEGCLVVLLGPTNGEWRNVDYRGTVGWAHSMYLVDVQPDSADCASP